MCCASIRAVLSAVPPGAVGTRILTGLLGQLDCAFVWAFPWVCAVAAKARVANAVKIARRIAAFMSFLHQHSRWCGAFRPLVALEIMHEAVFKSTAAPAIDKATSFMRRRVAGDVNKNDSIF